MNKYDKGLGGISPRLIILFSIIIIPVLTVSCATIALFNNKLHSANNIAENAGFKKKFIKTSDFTLLTYQKIKKPGETIRIYIEGDGNAWKTKTRLSEDPTPSNPVALYLAAEDDYENIVYIARPGQFISENSARCNSTYWSERRFSPEVINAFNKTIDQINTGAKSSTVELVGYSGGGALAILIASQRKDVLSIRTVAGNLDSQALCAYHRVSPLKGSLNPISYASEVDHIPQRHFIGSKDSVVPEFIALSFAEKVGDKNYDRITVVKGVAHAKGWRRRWKELLSLSPRR